MIQKYLLILTVVLSVIYSEGQNSKEPNYISDFSKTSSKLSCNGITMENYTGEINRNTVYYGEKITFYYKNMTGFQLMDGLAFPEMDIYATNVKGDTVLSQTRLMKNIKEGQPEDQLLLRSKITFANPMLPGSDYTIHINITDKNSDAFYHWEKNLRIINHPRFINDLKGVTYDILYLYSADREISVIDNMISPEEKIYVILEGLEGFTIDTDGKISLDCSIALEDANGTIVNSQKNLFPEPVSAVDLKSQLYASIVVSNGNVKNPVNCTLIIKDKQSDKYLETRFNLIVSE